MSTQQNSELTVGDVMLPLSKVPVVPTGMFLKQALEEMGRWRLGIACIVEEDGKLAGILTDGDIRRELLSVQKPFAAFFSDDVIDHAVVNPRTSTPNMTLRDAVELMEQHEVWDLPVVDAEGLFVGLLHLHPAVKLLLQNARR